MRIVMFYHSLLSDWNHGNAHFLRGVARELKARGHDVVIYEPHDAWSIQNLVKDQGIRAVAAFHGVYPELSSTRYDLDRLDVQAATDGADVVIVHEWNEPALVARLGAARQQRGFKLLFHDTHHRAVSADDEIDDFDLRNYDGVLAFGEALRQTYLRNSWHQRVYTWHEAADTTVFRPMRAVQRAGDVIWVGNWGDDERSREIREFLIEPLAALGLRARVHGVRYPARAIEALRQANIEYGGWIANYQVPHAFAQFRVTLHIPRRPYVEHLPGIPTIRVFEALACGIPLISAPWEDVEGLFSAGADFLVAQNSAEMKQQLRAVISDPDLHAHLRAHGLRTIEQRHTCVHRVDQLLGICADLGAARATVSA